MARRSAGTGARTRTGTPPGARPAAPYHSGPAPARPPWRPSAGKATTTDGVRSPSLPLAQPQRCRGRLHGVVDHAQQLAGQGVQVDLVTQAGAEGGDRLGGVVAAAVEAAVHHRLDPAAQG